MHDVLSIPGGDAGHRYLLSRFPLPSRPPLRAWDAADAFLINESLINESLKNESLMENCPGSERAAQTQESNTATLIINDSFGALACALHAYAPMHWGDSWLACAAIRNNLVHNALPVQHFVPGDELPRGRFRRVLIKLPKSLSLLDYQLSQLRPLLSDDAVVLAGAMVKHLQPAHSALLERYIGPVRASLAQKKARLLQARVDTSLASTPSPFPSRYRDDFTGLELIEHAGVFARGSLDIGARFMLEQFGALAKTLPAVRAAVDLGCGNGVLGLALQQHMPEVQVHFVDESWLAIASARLGQAANFPARAAQFHVSDGLRDFNGPAADLVLCNPPFHHQHSVDDTLALRLFRDAHTKLRPGGELWVVANRHLDYYHALRRLFGNCRAQAGNSKFSVLVAQKNA